MRKSTKSLPSRLNFFNVPYKQDKESSPGTSKSPQNSSNDNQEESPKLKHVPQVKLKIKQTTAVQALTKKYREQRAKKKASITELARKVKGKNMIRTRSKVLLEERHKKEKTQVEGKALPPPKAQIVRVKTTATALVKRLGASRLRAGLRSSGKLPVGSDIGIRTDRKPRSVVPIKTPQTPAKPLVRKLEKPTSTKSEKKEEKEKFSDNDEPLSKKSCTISTRSSRGIVRKVTPPTSLPNLKVRPTRKTKEAAAIYMEMLTKDLRSPEDDFEDDTMSVESFPELPCTKKSGQTDKKGKEKENKEQSPKGKNVKQSKSNIKSSSRERKEEPQKVKEEEKEKKPASTKANKGIANTRNSTGKKSLEKSVKQEEKKKPVEKRSTRNSTPNRKSVCKVREVSPPQRVLRTKRNRVSLAEDDESEEDELFESEVEEEPKKPSPKRNRPQRKSLKTEVESDEDSEPEIPVKRVSLVGRPRASEKKQEKKDKANNHVDTPKEIKSIKKELKEKKEEVVKQDKKAIKAELEKKEAKDNANSLEKKEEPKFTKTTRRSDVKMKQEEESPERQTPVKVEPKTAQRRPSKKEIVKVEEEVDNKEKDEKEEKNKTPKVSVKKENGDIKVEGISKGQIKRENSLDETSFSEVEEPVSKVTPRSRAGKKSLPKAPSVESVKQEKKTKLPDDLCVPHCKVIIESLDKMTKVLSNEQEGTSNSNGSSINSNNQKVNRNKDNNSAGSMNQKSSQKASKVSLKSRQSSSDVSEDSINDEITVTWKKLDKDNSNKNRKSVESSYSKLESLYQEKKDEPSKKELKADTKLSEDNESRLPVAKFSKEISKEIFRKEMTLSKAEANKQAAKNIIIPQPFRKEEKQMEPKAANLPEKVAETRVELIIPKPDSHRMEKKFDSPFKECDKPFKGFGKSLDSLLSKTGKDLSSKVTVTNSPKLTPKSLLDSSEIYPKQNEVSLKEKPSAKEQLHVDTNLPNIEKRDMSQEKYDSSENLLMNFQTKLNSISKGKETNGTALQADKIHNLSNAENSKASKPSIGDTWRQAFKNAKIPKPGQLSPIPHSVKPFVRKPFTSQPFMKHSQVKSALGDPDSKTGDDQVKDPSAKPNPAPLGFPMRRYFPREDSSKEQEIDKRTERAAKTLTQLQFERRTSELVSSLKETPFIDPHFMQVSTKPAAGTSKTEAPPKGNSVEMKTKEDAASTTAVKPLEGKHLNLPLAVEHTLRKSSTATVSKKPVPNVRYQIPQEAKDLVVKSAYKAGESSQLKPAPPKAPEHVHKCFDKDLIPSELVVNKPADVDLMMKKKVNMTTEEINRWLDDSTSSGIEHTKDCGIFERNQCECSFRTSGSSMEASSIGVSHLIPVVEDLKIGKSVVEPPVQLKEIAVEPKFCTETISTCKVEEYKEKILSKTMQSETVNEKNTGETKSEKQNTGSTSKPKKNSEKQAAEKVFKSPKSMTEEEMCEFDFRFERNLNSPGESGSEMSSPTPRDDLSSSNEESPEKQGQGPGQEHRKPIFHQKRSSNKRYPLSKSPCAFSPENESSVYAFEPDPPSKAKPFRRRGKSGESPASSSIAVQVNLETEAVLECSTQTERDAEDEGHLFYIPLQQGPNAGVPPQQLIQGVAVKLDTEGPDQRVIMRAELVTKPATAVTQTRSLVSSRSTSQKPEQKVRPLGSGGGGKPPPVGTVQPTVREPKRTDQATGTNEERPFQTTQATQSEKPIVKEKPQKEAPPPPPPAPAPSKPVKRQSTDSTGKTKMQPVVIGSTEFPAKGSQPCLLEAPTFRPTEKEFQDPLDYIDKITPQAQQFGICRIVPPSNFKPECKVSDEMRFTAYNQYIHKMLHRWGPNVKEMSAIRKYLATQNIALAQPPWIGGMEVDLPRLYQTVQQCGGLKEVIEKKRWTKVADSMKIPKSAQDRVTKLDDIYCKFLLPYDTLSHEERNKLLKEVEEEWRERERKADQEDNNSNDSDSDSDDFGEECITKGRSMALSAFYRIARNTMAMWFKDTPSPQDVETEFWKHVSTRQSHVCVHSGSIDSGTWGYGFPTVKSSSTSRHPWNLKVLTNNSGSILRSIGPLMGVTVPTLHVGMLFSACCWYRDPHALPWIEYLHTGASKIWYGVPDDWSNELRLALKSLLPRYVRDKPIWLASDTAMVPPGLLVDRGVALSRLTQEPGQFVLVFPRAFTSSVSTGYLVSESVYFARPSWLDSAEQVFKDVQESSEPTMFSLEKLLFCIATDVRSSVDVLNQVLPMVVSIRESEVRKRRELERVGLVGTERLPVTKGRRTKVQEEQDDYECESCRANLFLSLVANSHEEANYCLNHAIEMLTKDMSQLKFCKLLYGYDEEEMEELIEKVKSRIEIKSQKKPHSKNSGGGSSSKS